MVGNGSSPKPNPKEVGYVSDKVLSLPCLQKLAQKQGIPLEKLSLNNGRFFFADKKEEKVVCRHFAALLADSATEGKLRFDKLLEQLPNVTQCMAQQLWEKFSQDLTIPAIVVNNDKFTSELQQYLADHSTPSAVRRFLILTSKHVMLLVAKRRKNDWRWKCYDPNDWPIQYTAQVDGHKLPPTLRELFKINEKRFHSYFFGKQAGTHVMLFDLPPTPIKAAPSLTLPPERPLGVFSTLLRNNRLAQALEQHSSVALPTTWTDDEIRDLAYAFHIALQNGYAESITAFTPLVKILLEKWPPEQTQPLAFMKEILLAKDEHGKVGLYMALQEGHDKAITAFTTLADRLLEKWPPEQAELHDLIEKILLAKTKDGKTWLLMALYNGHTKAIKAYTQLFSAQSIHLNTLDMRFFLFVYSPQTMELLLKVALEQVSKTAKDQAAKEALVAFINQVAAYKKTIVLPSSIIHVRDISEALQNEPEIREALLNLIQKCAKEDVSKQKLIAALKDTVRKENMSIDL